MSGVFGQLMAHEAAKKTARSKEPLNPPPSMLRSPPKLAELAARTCARSFDTLADTSLLDLQYAQYDYIISPFEGLDARTLHLILNAIDRPEPKHFELLIDAGLRRLDLSAPHIVGAVTDRVARVAGRCTLLERLALANCKKVSSRMLYHLVSSVDSGRLTAVDLSGTKVEDIVLEQLAVRAKGLTSLALAGTTKITSRGVGAVLSGCKHLRALDVSYCARVTSLGAPLGNALRCLKISGTTIGDSSFMKAQRGMPSLEVFEASLSAVTEASIVAIMAPPGDLQQARPATALTDAAVAMAAEVSDSQPRQMARVALGGCRIAGTVVELLCRSTVLTCVDISGTGPAIRWAHVQRLAAASGATITELNLSQLHGIWLYFLALSLPRLKRLVVAGCTGVRVANDTGYVHATAEPAQSHAGFHNLMAFEAAGIQLERLSAAAEAFDPSVIMQLMPLVRKCRVLERLDLSRCGIGKNATELSADPDAEFLLTLKDLNLSHSPKLVPAALERVLWVTPRLERLAIANCKLIGKRHMRNFVRILPWLTVDSGPESGQAWLHT